MEVLEKLKDALASSVANQIDGSAIPEMDHGSGLREMSGLHWSSCPPCLDIRFLPCAGE